MQYLRETEVFVCATKWILIGRFKIQKSEEFIKRVLVLWVLWWEDELRVDHETQVHWTGLPGKGGHKYKGKELCNNVPSSRNCNMFGISEYRIGRQVVLENDKESCWGSRQESTHGKFYLELVFLQGRASRGL